MFQPLSALVCFSVPCFASLRCVPRWFSLPLSILLFRSLQFRWLFNGSGSLFSLVCPLQCRWLFNGSGSYPCIAAHCRPLPPIAVPLVV